MIVVCGSANMDLVVRAKNFPNPGETMLGSGFLTSPGGKGANQAVAAARLDGRVAFFGKVGEDAFGKELLDSMHAAGVDVSHVWKSYEPTGVALITVREDGENTIVVAPGSNTDLHPGDVRRSFEELEDPPRVVLAQLEIPLKSAGACFLEALSRNAPWRILNPAPAAPLPASIYRSINAIVPNETEAESLTGISLHEDEALPACAKEFHDRGVSHVAITLGAKGVFVSSPDGMEHLSAPKVDSADTTAAGDCFCGALAVGLSEGADFAESCYFAVRAASLSVSRLGAQASMPARSEL